MSLIASPPGAAGDVLGNGQDERGQIVLFIADNGRGFDPDDIPAAHLGVGIMRERAQAAGARLELNSEPGHGTQVTVTWPDLPRMEKP
jgi:signal transduction histidine kinase